VQYVLSIEFFTWIGKSMWFIISSSVFFQMTNVSRSQRVAYTVNVVVSWKWCKTELPLARTTNKKWYMAYQITAIPMMTLSDLQGHSPTASLLTRFFTQYIHQFTADLFRKIIIQFNSTSHWGVFDVKQYATILAH